MRKRAQGTCRLGSSFKHPNELCVHSSIGLDEVFEILNGWYKSRSRCRDGDDDFLAQICDPFTIYSIAGWNPPGISKRLC